MASALQAVAGAAAGRAPDLDTAFVAAALLGAGYGAYMSVDQALVTAVLPDAADRAKDLGIMNIGSVGPAGVRPAAGQRADLAGRLPGSLFVGAARGDPARHRDGLPDPLGSLAVP